MQQGEGGGEPGGQDGQGEGAVNELLAKAWLRAAMHAWAGWDGGGPDPRSPARLASSMHASTFQAVGLARPVSSRCQCAGSRKDAWVRSRGRRLPKTRKKRRGGEGQGPGEDKVKDEVDQARRTERRTGEFYA